MSIQITTTGLSYFGNMTLSSGGAGIWDTNNATYGYLENPAGWSGVALGAAKKIEKLTLRSQSYGWDCSGSQYTITLKLYGKNGSAPANSTDGTLLGQVGPFTDPNAVDVKTITNTNAPAAEFTHVWFTLTSTGGWAGVWDSWLYEPDAVTLPTLPVIGAANPALFERSVNAAVFLPTADTELSGFRIAFETTEARKILAHFHADTINSNNREVGYGFRILHRTAATQAGLASASFVELPNCLGGHNIINDTHHYGHVSITGSKAIPAGFHEFSILGYSGNGLGMNGSLLYQGRGINGLHVQVLLPNTEYYNLT